MKQKDFLLIGVIVFMSAAFSLVITRFVLAKPDSRKQEVEVVQAISADFPEPNPKYFNAKSFDPTKLITIGSNNNNDPFSNLNSK